MRAWSRALIETPAPQWLPPGTDWTRPTPGSSSQASS